MGQKFNLFYMNHVRSIPSDIVYHYWAIPETVCFCIFLRTYFLPAVPANPISA